MKNFQVPSPPAKIWIIKNDPNNNKNKHFKKIIVRQKNSKAQKTINNINENKIEFFTVVICFLYKENVVKNKNETKKNNKKHLTPKKNKKTK